MATRDGESAGALLLELYGAGNRYLPDYPWEFEADRWGELISCALTVGIGIDSDLARAVVTNLTELGMTSVPGLARATNEDRQFVAQLLRQHGVEPATAVAATTMMCSLAKTVDTKWKGYIQRFLRDNGERMANDLGEVLRTLGLPRHTAKKIAILWLQNVANLPVLLPKEPHIQAFCERFNLSERQLVDTADRLGLNVSVLDDLLALEAESGEPSGEVKSIHRPGRARRGSKR